MTYEPEPANDSHIVTLQEIGSILALVLGAVCVAVAVVVDRRWKA